MTPLPDLDTWVEEARRIDEHPSDIWDDAEQARRFLAVTAALEEAKAANRDLTDLLAEAAANGVAAVEALDKATRWKVEATFVLNEWEKVHDALGRPGALGESKAAASASEIERLRGFRDECERQYQEQVEKVAAELDARLAAEARATVAEEALDALRGRVAGLHEPIRVYDECDHPDGHGCEPIEVYDYMGCSESVIGWGCSTCCYDDEYPREDCPHGADHTDVPREKSCPTHDALLDTTEES